MCSRFLLVLFQYKFHQKGSMSQCAAFCYIRPTKSTTLHRISFFPLIFYPLNCTSDFMQSHLSSILFSSLIADFIFANQLALLLLLIHQEITLVSITPPKEKSILIYLFSFYFNYNLGAKNSLVSLTLQRV